MQALNLAKQDYFLSRDAFSSYDEKTLSEAELYGLPMYGVGAPPPRSAPRRQRAAAPVSPTRCYGSASSTSPRQGCSSAFAGTAVPGRRLRGRPRASAVPVTGLHGSYYTNAGQVQAPNYRPLQPYVTLSATRTRPDRTRRRDRQPHE